MKDLNLVMLKDNLHEFRIEFPETIKIFNTLSSGGFINKSSSNLEEQRHYKTLTTNGNVFKEFFSLIGFELIIEDGYCYFVDRINSFNDEKIKYSMLDSVGVKKLAKILDKSMVNHLSKNINKAKQVFDIYAFDEYLRDSNISKITTSSKELIENYKISTSIWDSKLKKTSLTKLNYLLQRYPLEEKKIQIREEFEKRKLYERKNFYEKIESNPLTEQQRQAVIRNNDLNLVLAAAGTGKTSVIVVKALDLIDSGMATSDEILILAYNNAAAKELKERLMVRSAAANLNFEKPPTISTFHALGKKILKNSRVNTDLIEFVKDSKKLELWVTNWLGEYISKTPASLFKFLELSYHLENI